MKKEYGEKYLESKLGRDLKREGGLSLKLLSTFVTGLPDRMCMLHGRMCFAEIKTTGKKPRPSQVATMRMLESHGFRTFVVDTPEGISDVITYLKGGEDGEI